MSDTLISFINITTSTFKIQIVQHNYIKNVNVMHSLLNSTMNKDIVLIQESWIFKDNKTTVSHSAFTTLLSSSSLDVRSWTVTFINKNRQNFVCTLRLNIFMNSDLQTITISINTHGASCHSQAPNRRRLRGETATERRHWGVSSRSVH